MRRVSCGIHSESELRHQLSPSLERAHVFLTDKFGQETADRLCIENPRVVFMGEPMPKQPTPMGLEQKKQAKGGLLGRMFGR